MQPFTSQYEVRTLKSNEQFRKYREMRESKIETIRDITVFDMNPIEEP